jgi:hypothetical protein
LLLDDDAAADDEASVVRFTDVYLLLSLVRVVDELAPVAPDRVVLLDDVVEDDDLFVAAEFVAVDRGRPAVDDDDEEEEKPAPPR